MSFPQYSSSSSSLPTHSKSQSIQPRDAIISAFSKIMNNIKMNKVMETSTAGPIQPAYQITTNPEPNLKRSTLSYQKDNMSTLAEYAPSITESFKSKDKSQMNDEQLEKFYIQISLQELAKLPPNQISDFMARKEEKEIQQNRNRRMPKSSKMSLKCAKEDASESKRCQNAGLQIKKSSKKDNESWQTAVQMIPQQQEYGCQVRKMKKQAKKQSKKAEKPRQLVIQQVIPIIQIVQLIYDYEAEKKSLTKNVVSKKQENNLREQFIEIILQCDEIVHKPPQKLKKGLVYESNEEENLQKYIVKQYQEVQQVNEISGLPLNTGNSSLSRLVQELFKNNLINKAAYDEFCENDSPEITKQFIEKFKIGKLHNFNYSKIKFTLLDHRRISSLLQTLYPQSYTRGTIYSPDQIVLDFLNRLYSIEALDYLKLLERIDQISKIKWWSKINTIQNENLISIYQEKKLVRKQTRQAMASVRAVVEARNAGVVNLKEAPRRTLQQVYSIDCDESKQRQIEMAAKKMLERQKQKQRKQQKEQEDQAIAKIRAIVSNFGKKSEPNECFNGRKKVKFT